MLYVQVIERRLLQAGIICKTSQDGVCATRASWQLGNGGSGTNAAEPKCQGAEHDD